MPPGTEPRKVEPGSTGDALREALRAVAECLLAGVVAVALGLAFAYGFDYLTGAE